MDEIESFALEFVRTLDRREFAAAYAMTTREFRAAHSLADVERAYTELVWDEEPSGGIEVGSTMQDWPDKQPGEVGWVYVAIDLDVCSEGVTVVVARSAGQLLANRVEWGRP